MNITPTEAEDALAAIQSMVHKTRRAISGSGAYAFMVIWGAVWLIGFLGNQFLPEEWIGWNWLIIDTLGGIASWVIGARMNRVLRSASSLTTGRRIGLFWLLVIVYAAIAIAVAWPVGTLEVAMYIVLFVMLGLLAMSLLLSLISLRPTLVITGVAVAAYFLLPAYFHLIMGILCGGGLIVFGLYIRNRW